MSPDNLARVHICSRLGIPLLGYIPTVADPTSDVIFILHFLPLSLSFC